jgi:hypothetical protein
MYSPKYTGAAQNYDKLAQMLLAILETLKQWHHYLEGGNHQVLIQCNLKNLEHFQTSQYYRGGG